MPRVLVVDDDASLLRLVSMIFLSEDDGWEVETAPDGDSAIRRLSVGDAPDVVVLDVMMPLISGIEVLGWIREHEWLYDLPVVMLTAKTAEEDVLVGWRTGCDAYITKPYDPVELVSTCRQLADSAAELRVARRQDRLAMLLSS